jgi:hypothetical protein
MRVRLHFSRFRRFQLLLTLVRFQIATTVFDSPLTMPKRKAVDEPDEAPPKTNRQIREEAKARAREWAANQQAGKKTTAAKASLARPSEPAPKSAPTPKPEPAAKKQKLNSGKAAKPTKKQTFEEAKARAQAWAEEQQAAKSTTSAHSPTSARRRTPITATRTSATKKPKEESAKKPAKEKKDEETKQEAARVEPAPVEPPNAATEPSQGTMTPEMQAALMRAHQESIARAQMENAWANNYFAQMAAMAPGPPQQQQQHMLSPQELEMHRLQQQVTENSGMGFMPQFNYMNMSSPPMNAPRPRNMAPPAMNSPPRGFASPPPRNVPSRSRSPAAAKKSPIRIAPAPDPDPVVAKHGATAPSEPPKEADHPPIEQDDEVKESERSNLSRWLTIGVPFFLLSAIVAVASSMAFINVEEAFILGLNHSVHKEPGLPPCFHSHPPEEDEELGNCDRSKRWKPCPDMGVCSGGELRSCAGLYHDISESLDQCILSAASNETLAKVEEVLAGWTVEHTCKLFGCDHALKNPDAIAPFFDISVVTDAVNVSESTLRVLLYHWSDDIQVLSVKDGEFIVGLTDDYVEHKLVVPTLCYLGFWLVWFMDLMVKSFLGAAHWATGWALTLTMAYPFATVMTVLTLWAVFALRKHRRQRQKLKQDVANVRQLAYAKLREDVSKDFIVIFLRDEVAMDVWPTSKSNRAYIIHKVWPRVVADVRHDNRVKKSNTMVQGTRRDVWQWTASTNSNKKVPFDKTN